MHLSGMARKDTLEFSIGSTDAVVRRGGTSLVVTAKVVGSEIKGGIEFVYLDRLVHRRDDLAEDWTLSGGVTTILSRRAER